MTVTDIIRTVTNLVMNDLGFNRTFGMKFPDEKSHIIPINLKMFHKVFHFNIGIILNEQRKLEEQSWIDEGHSQVWDPNEKGFRPCDFVEILQTTQLLEYYHVNGLVVTKDVVVSYVTNVVVCVTNTVLGYIFIMCAKNVFYRPI